MKKRRKFEAEDYKMCINCLMAKPLNDGEIVICQKHGLKNHTDACRHFEINLLAITPKKLRTFNTTFSEEDFKL